jgi:hypothetical protein
MPATNPPGVKREKPADKSWARVNAEESSGRFLEALEIAFDATTDNSDDPSSDPARIRAMLLLTVKHQRLMKGRWKSVSGLEAMKVIRGYGTKFPKTGASITAADRQLPFFEAVGQVMNRRKQISDARCYLAGAIDALAQHETNIARTGQINPRDIFVREALNTYIHLVADFAWKAKKLPGRSKSSPDGVLVAIAGLAA